MKATWNNSLLEKFPGNMVTSPIMDILKVIHERRSIRAYRDEPVPEEIILEVLEAARRSPSWANTQAWRFIVVKDPETKELLSSALTPNNPCRKAIAGAPIVVCLVGVKGVSGCYKGQATTNKGDWFMFDAGIAMEHLVLAAWNFGLGTCHVGSFDAVKVEEILEIPEGFAIIEMTPVGYFDEPSRVTPRKPLKDVVFAGRFGVPYLS
jgi:nitroreductase